MKMLRFLMNLLEFLDGDAAVALWSNTKVLDGAV